ncbi:MAG TPA: bifunctional riboflavin kinase/FAD synthetase [Anaerolineales bacterium]|nr:bifunctional riboflavin kinase/FAD synthetase [Anaerolineales bacterium]
MIHAHSLDELQLHNSWVTIGVFDGVHRGHQRIINQLTTGAHAKGASAVVLTFWPHPAFVLGRGEAKSLTTPDERAELLGSFGADVVLTHPFDAVVANLSAREFMTRLKEHLGIQHLFMGYDFALGKGREGDATRLAGLGREMGFTTEVIEAVSDESGVISSTEIRKLVSVGDVADAAKLLGRNYSLRGAVTHGDGRGRKMNIPTANVDYPHEKVIPANGIYAAWAWVDGRKHMSAVNIGINPTFTPEKQTPNVEAYLLDFNQDIYGKDVKVEFVRRLRDEIKFASVNELIAQIQEDIARVREMLRTV